MSKRPEIPVIYSPGEALNAALVDGLEEAAKEGAAQVDDRRIWRADLRGLDAATLTPRPETELLFVGVHGPGAPGIVWHQVARFDTRDVAGRQHIEARPYRGQLGAPTLAALEQAFQRRTFSEYLLGKTAEAQQAKLEGAAMVTLPTGTKVLHCRYRGLWWGVASYRRLQRVPAPLSRAEAGYNYPEIAIT